MEINIGSGNGLMPLGNMPLPEPLLTQMYITVWHHSATMILTHWAQGNLTSILKYCLWEHFIIDCEKVLWYILGYLIHVNLSNVKPG